MTTQAAAANTPRSGGEKSLEGLAASARPLCARPRTPYCLEGEEAGKAGVKEKKNPVYPFLGDLGDPGAAAAERPRRYLESPCSGVRVVRGREKGLKRGSRSSTKIASSAPVNNSFASLTEREVGRAAHVWVVDSQDATVRLLDALADALSRTPSERRFTPSHLVFETAVIEVAPGHRLRQVRLHLLEAQVRRALVHRLELSLHRSPVNPALAPASAPGGHVRARRRCGVITLGGLTVCLVLGRCRARICSAARIA